MLPLMQNPENKPKNRFFLSQLLIIIDIQTLFLDICFEDDKKDVIS